MLWESVLFDVVPLIVADDIGAGRRLFNFTDELKFTAPFTSSSLAQRVAKVCLFHRLCLCVRMCLCCTCVRADLVLGGS